MIMRNIKQQSEVTVRRKTGFKNYHVHIGVLVLIMLVGLSIIYSYKMKTAENSKDQSIADAIASFDAGNQEEAITMIKSILSNDPGNEEAETRLAYFYYQSGDYDSFIKFVDDNNLKSSTLYNMMATAYQGMGDNQKAEEYFNLALISNAKSTQVYINFAAYYQSQGNYGKALGVLEKGLEINEKSTSLLISAASVSLKMGNKVKAKEYANRVLEANPDNAQAKAILTQAK